MNIRPLCLSEIPIVVDSLWKPLMTSLGGDDSTVHESEQLHTDTTDHWRRRINRSDSQTFVMTDGDTFVGYVNGELEPMATVLDGDLKLCVRELFVTESHRGDGYGTDLLNQIEEWGRRQGCSRIEVAVGNGNIAAQLTYHKNGYESIRRTMKKPLDTN